MTRIEFGDERCLELALEFGQIAVARALLCVRHHLARPFVEARH